MTRMDNIDYAWSPRPSDVAWTKSHLARIRDGGTWCLPMNSSIWKVDHPGKRLVCVSGTRDDMFHKITVCCNLIGYATELAPDAAPKTTVPADAYGTGKAASRINGTHV